MRRHRLTSNSDQISVELPQLRVAGTWTATTAPFQHTVYQNACGSVFWNCLQPASSAHVTVGDRDLTGLGYAECLTLTLPPWQLPMRQLRWGRFVSPQDSLVWIDWQGPYSTSLAVHNSLRCEVASISDSEIILNDVKLHLDMALSLRSGRLGATILPGAPQLRKLLPHSLFNIDEKKWRSQGTLDTPDRQSHGWAIHEVVDWNC
jgi:hypothetical protein